MGTAAFIGRESELAALISALDDARGGAGGAVLVSGEAGIGKTRLVAELAEHARAIGAAVAWGRCWEAGGAPPFWPWVEVLRVVGGAELLDDVGAHGPAAERFPVFDAVCRRLVAAAGERPLLVLLDDVHAADVPSVLLLELLARAAGTAPLLAVAAYREHEAADGGAAGPLGRLRRAVRHVRLSGLDLPATAALIADATGRPAEPAQAERVWVTTGGNPLFVGEMAGLAPGAPVPAGVRQALRGRLAGLSAEAVGLLRAAAVGGRRVDAAVLSAVTGQAVDDALIAAVRAGVLVPEDAGRYRFAHILVRDGLAEDITALDRAGLHSRYADILTRPQHGPASLAEVALHRRAGLGAGDRRAALEASIAAGEHALSVLAYEPAAAEFTAALELVDDPSERLDLLLTLGTAHDRAGAAEAAREAYGRAARAAEAAGDAERAARAALGLTTRTAFQRADPAAEQVLRRALQPLSEGSLRARVLAALARVLAYGSRAAEAAEVAAGAVREARSHGDAQALAEALHAFQVSSWRPETVAARVAGAEELAVLAGEAGDLSLAADAEMWRLIAHVQRCDIAGIDRAIAGYQAVAERSHQPRHAFVAASRRAMRAYLRGRLDEGDALADTARALGLAAGEPDAEIVTHGLRLLPYRNAGRDVADLEEAFREFAARHTSVGSRCALAVLALDRGATAEAAAHLDALAADDFAAVPPDMDALLSWSLLAEVAARVGDLGRCRTLYARLAPFAGHGAQVAGAVCFAGVVDHYLGLLAQAIGRAEAAQRHFDDAERIHLAMGAQPWAERTAAARAAGARARGRVAPESHLVFRPVRAGWEVGPLEAPLHLPDAKGLRILARLLAQPGQELHVLDLDGRLAEPGTGPALDGQARAAYRRRVEELRAAVEQAREDADPARAERAEEDLAALTAHLAAAIGRHGRPRETGSGTERARVAVRKAVAKTLHRIAERDPDLGRLLAGTIRTGTYCRYEPDPRWPVRWEL